MTRHCISNRYMPPNLNLPNLLLYVTALHYWNAPGWLWGAAGAVLFVFYVLVIISIYISKPRHPLDLPRD
jgi:hypothetical protein